LNIFLFWVRLAAMRRALASLLLVSLSLPLIPAALFASDSDSKLPLCCRRNGHHGCAMAPMQLDPSSPAARSGTCPAFPAVKAVLTNPTVGLAAISLPASVRLVSTWAPGLQMESRCVSSNNRAGQTRGPPDLV